MELIYLLIGLVVLIVIIGLFWDAIQRALTLLPNNPTLRTVLAILAILVLIMIIWYFFGGFVRLPR